MGRIIIAGNEWALPDDVSVCTFMDPGGFSFYSRTGASFAPLVFSDEFDETRSLVMPRRLPGGGVSGIGGGGWSAAGGGNPNRALRKVITTSVLHHDAAHSSRGCYNTLVNRGFSTHFMIDHDGTVFQAADVADMTIHAAGLNRMSIGIDLNNPADNLLSDPGADAPGRHRSGEMVINGVSLSSWTYTDEQYRSLIAVLRVLVEVVGIEPVFPVGEDGRILDSVLDSPSAGQFKGIQCHWHSSAVKWDPGPGFDWERVLAGLRREDVGIPAVPVGVAEVVRGMRDRGALRPEDWSSEEAARRVIAGSFESEATAERMCRVLCRAIEKSSQGGFYPMGVNQTWHGGIHVPVADGASVRPMLSGDLVAAHLVDEDSFPRMGSNNFVVLRHRIPLPPRFDEGDESGREEEAGDQVRENILTVYSLYMHLDGVDIESQPDSGLFEALRAHAGGSPGAMSPPQGPMLQTVAKEPDQMRALRAGYVGLFSPVDDEDAAIRLTPRDTLWKAGRFGQEGEWRRVVHVEVFADRTFSDAMELGLYGRYLQLGPDEPDSMDMMVRSRSLLSIFGGHGPVEAPVKNEKTLDMDAIRDFFEYNGDDEQTRARERLRRLITRHVSEWSDSVSWIDSLFAAQDAQGWKRLLRRSDADWVFRQEVMTYLPYVWMTEEVATHIGARWDNGVFNHFHPVYFLLWWMYRRSAVRGKSLDEILKEVGGGDLSTTRGVIEELEDILYMRGEGEWEL